MVYSEARLFFLNESFNAQHWWQLTASLRIEKKTATAAPDNALNLGQSRSSSKLEPFLSPAAEGKGREIIASVFVCRDRYQNVT